MPRLETFALASYSEKTKGVLILGIDPIKEKEVNNLHEKIIEGQYIETVNDNACCFGEAGSELKLRVNDNLGPFGSRRSR